MFNTGSRFQFSCFMCLPVTDINIDLVSGCDNHSPRPLHTQLLSIWSHRLSLSIGVVQNRRTLTTLSADRYSTQILGWCLEIDRDSQTDSWQLTADGDLLAKEGQQASEKLEQFFPQIRDLRFFTVRCSCRPVGLRHNTLMHAIGVTPRYTACGVTLCMPTFRNILAASSSMVKGSKMNLQNVTSQRILASSCTSNWILYAICYLLG
jgi:hypothetical protein